MAFSEKKQWFLSRDIKSTTLCDIPLRQYLVPHSEWLYAVCVYVKEKRQKNDKGEKKENEEERTHRRERGGESGKREKENL